MPELKVLTVKTGQDE